MLSNIILACELGDGYGHINRLIHVAEFLSKHNLLFIVPGEIQFDAVRAHFGNNVQCAIKTPNLNVKMDKSKAQEADVSLAHTMLNSGVFEPMLMEKSCREWKSIIDNFPPDLVISDFAPTLRVVTKNKYACLVVGTGYTIPISSSPLASYFGRSPQALLINAEQEMLRAVNSARMKMRLPSIKILAELFYGDETFVMTWPFLDPYRDLRDSKTWPPINVPSMPFGPPTNERTGPDIFAYLDAAYAPINSVLTAINLISRPAHLFVKGIDPHALVAHCASSVTIHTKPANLSRLLPQTRLLIHHGGAATGVAGLLAGTPQLIFPRNLEQTLNARGLVSYRTSIAVAAKRQASPTEFADIMIGALNDDGLSFNAQSSKMHISNHTTKEVGAAIVNSCWRLLQCQ